MVLQLNRDGLSDHTERYHDAGLPAAFLAEMQLVVKALRENGYEPYDQLTGFVRTGNELYITRHGNARDMILKMDIQDIKTFLRHYNEHK